MTLIGTIDKHDVSANSFVRGGRHYPIHDAIGRVMEVDVGKLVYYNGGVVQVESSGQRDTRLEEDA